MSLRLLLCIIEKSGFMVKAYAYELGCFYALEKQGFMVKVYAFEKKSYENMIFVVKIIGFRNLIVIFLMKDFSYTLACRTCISTSV
jgi:hypothetical protein